MANKKEPVRNVAARVDFAADLQDIVINNDLQARRLFIELNGEVRRVKAAFWGRSGALYLTDTDDYVDEERSDSTIRKA